MMQNFMNLLGMVGNQSKSPSTSKIYFSGIEHPSEEMTSMKSLFDNLVDNSCPKCDTLVSQVCKCKPILTELEKTFKKLIFPTSDSLSTLNACLDKLGNGKTVCGKIMTSKHIGFKCLDCGLDPTCIICLECFEKSNHKGHRTIQQSSCAGWCDCGDKEAWRPEGFCTDHQGFKGDEIEKIHSLPAEFLKNYYDSFRMVFYLFFLGCEDFFTREGLIPSSKLMKIWRVIRRLLNIINKNENFILNAVLFDLLRQGKNPGFKLAHECKNREELYLSNNKNQCECSILENLFRFNLLLDNNGQKEIAEMCITLFGFYEFKQYLILTYAKMFPFFFVSHKKKLNQNKAIEHNKQSAILDLNVQLFTSDELAKKLIEDEAFDGFLDFQVNDLLHIREKPELFDSYRLNLQHHHLEYMSSKPIICQLLCRKLTFFNKFFEMLFAFNQMVSYDIEIPQDREKIESLFSILDVEVLMFNILENIVKTGIKTMEKQERNTLLDCLINSLIKIMRKEEDSTDPSFHIPVQRAFALILAVKLYYNKELFEKQTLTQYLLTMNFESVKSFELFLITQFSIVSKLFVFLKEIHRNFWKDYCNLLNVYPSIHTNNRYLFYDLDHTLFQILLSLLSENDGEIVLDFLQRNSSVRIFLNKVSQINNEMQVKIDFPSGETINLFEELIDVLLKSVTQVNLPLMNIWSFLDCEIELESLKKETMKKVINGILIQSHALDIKSIKTKVFNFVKETNIEPFLEEVADFDTKTKLFKLKFDNINDFDPFIFMRDSTFMFEAFENIKNKFKDKELLGLDAEFKSGVIEHIRTQCLGLISKDFFFIIIKLLSQSENVTAYPSFLKRLLKLFSQLLDYLLERNQKYLFLIFKQEKTLRNSLNSLQNSSVFPNINLSIESILKKMDLVSLQLPELKAKTSSEEAKLTSQMKKEVFLQKQKELKNKFLLQQNKFKEKNQQFLEEEFKATHHQMVCVICKEEVNEKAPYGQLAFMSKTNVYKYARYHQFLKLRLDENDQDLLPFLNGIDWKSDLFKEIQDQYCFSSCFHCLHLQCFKNFIKGKKNVRDVFLEVFEFTCPLCHRLSNIFIPFEIIRFQDISYDVKNWKKDIEIDLNEGLQLKGKEIIAEKKKSQFTFFDDVVMINVAQEEKSFDNVIDIMENALISVVESLQINGFNFFLNKQLQIYKNLLFLFRVYFNEVFDSSKKELEIRKNKIANLRKLIINEAKDVKIFSNNLEGCFINYAILIFLTYNWQPEDLYRHLSSLFEYVLLWAKIQFLFKRNYKTSKNHPKTLENVLCDNDFIKIHLRLLQTFLSLNFLMFSFDETILQNLNNKSFISDEEELKYLHSLLPIPLKSTHENFNTNELLKKLMDHYDSIKNPKEQFLFVFESLKIDLDLYFKLYELEPRFSDLMNQFSGQKCDVCHGFSKVGELSLCLICGATICNRVCYKESIQERGNLNIHALENHCGNSVFISFHKCDIFLIATPKNFMDKSLLYTDKYGQGIKLKSLDWGSFVLNTEEYNVIREILVKNNVPQEILYRSVKHNVYYKQNVY